jgi:hypothetical protein
MVSCQRFSHHVFSLIHLQHYPCLQNFNFGFSRNIIGQKFLTGVIDPIAIYSVQPWAVSMTPTRQYNIVHEYLEKQSVKN